MDIIDGLGAHEVRNSSDSTRLEESVAQPKQFKSAYGDSAATKTALYRVLVGDRSNRSHEVANDLNLSIFNLPSNAEAAIRDFESLGLTEFAMQRRIYAQWQNWRKAHRALFPGDCYFDDYFTEKIPENPSNEDHWDAYLRWSATVSGRRFVTTKGGRFGWTVDYRNGSVEEQTRKGDVFCIIFGCTTPIVIRPHGECYQVLGEGYVQGLMDGEVLAWLDNGKHQVQDITFC